MPPTVRTGMCWLGLGILLALAALVGLVSPGATPQAVGAPPAAPLFDPPQQYITEPAIDVYVRGSDLFYTRSCGRSGLFDPPSFVYWRATTASTSNTVYRNAGACSGAPGTPAHVGSHNVAADSTYAYWITANGYVVRLALRPAAGAAPQSLVSGSPISLSGDPLNYWVAVDNSYVYWNEGADIYRVAKAGGAKSRAFRLPRAASRLYALGSNRLLLLQIGDDTLKVLRLDTTPHRTDQIGANVRAYAVGADRIYWASRVGTHYEIASVSRTTLGDQHPFYQSTANVGERVNSMAVDGSNLYWHEQRGLGSSGPIYRKALSPASAPAHALTANLPWVDGLASGGAFLYWTDTSAVWRLPVGSTPLPPPTTGNIWITGFHAVQAIQVNNNLIPLLGRKPTVLRVYARSQTDTFGEWLNVTGRLEVEGSTRLHYTTGVTVSTAGSNPGNVRDSFNYLLDPEETAPGTRRFTATIFSPSGRPETSLVDNTSSFTLTFGREITMVLGALTYANRTTGITCTDAMTDGIFPVVEPLYPGVERLTENLMPLSRVFMYTMDESGRETFDNGDCKAYDPARAWGGRILDLEHAQGGVRAVVFQPENFCGCGACCAGLNGNRAMTAHSVVNSTVAHEMTHSFGGVFGCCHPWDADMHYPRGEPFGIGPYYGFNHTLDITPTYGVPRGDGAVDGVHTNVYDLMSYYNPQWPSPYTYCRTVDYASAGELLCDSSVEGGGHLTALGQLAADSLPSAQPGRRASGIGAQTLEDYLYVAGRINPDGSATFDPFEIISSDEDIASLDTGKTYTLTLKNLDDTVLVAYQFDPLAAHTDPVSKIGDPQPFSAYVPWYDDTSVIELGKAGTVLISRTVSSNKPVVTLDFDPGTEEVTGTQTVQWTATDDDGDPLTFSVWYSADNGTSWRIVDTGLTDTQTDVDFNRLPGSQTAWLLVSATDGVLTGLGQMDASFSVAFKPPSVRVAAAQSVAASGVIGAAEGASVNGQLVEATAWDPEDGVITDPARYVWWDSGQYASWVVGHGYSFNTAALSPGHHFLNVQVTDSHSMEGWAFVEVDVPSTPEQGGATASPSGGGRLEFPALLGIQLTIPAGAVAQVTQFNASLADDTSLDPPRLVGRSFHISATTSYGDPVTTFSVPLGLAVGYGSALVSGADEPRLQLATWDASKHQWNGLTGVVDTKNKVVRATLTHLSRFALVVGTTAPHLYLPCIMR